MEKLVFLNTYVPKGLSAANTFTASANSCRILKQNDVSGYNYLFQLSIHKYKGKIEEDDYFN